MAHVVRVWDLPTRFFHWSLLTCVLGLFTTGQLGGSAMDWHFRFGYATLSLLVFRLLWGLFGGYWSRFSSFPPNPAAAFRYLLGRGAASISVGHNPLGAFSVLAMLLFLVAQVLTGLFSDDEIASAGPLARLASSDLVSLATWYHTQLGKPVLIVLIVTHVIAIGFYFWRRKDNLIRPMILGDKSLPLNAPSSRDDARSRLLALLLYLLSVGAILGLLRWAA